MNTKTLKENGFTIIELIVVISIVSIIYGVAAMKWGSMGNLNAQAMQLANDIRYTQSLSMARNKHYRLITSQLSYIIQDENGYKEYEVFLGSKISATSCTISFNTKGIPLDDNGLPIDTVATVILSAPGQSINITITPTTGMVTP